jgi:MerR family transcriptional regulator, light-induced transcriptional regulator
MTPYMSRFQIRDLEEFSGVKAHTIRMWEKRYGLLEPDRTGTNIRTYSLDELKAILNVAFLNQHGIKISKIAAMSSADRERMVNEVSNSRVQGSDILNSLKLAMLSFDEVLFESASSRFREMHGFRALVEQVYVPLLEQIGILWQSNTICPAQEHFVSNIIRHKLIMASGALPLNAAPRDRLFVLYLPENEIHELGLLYIEYLLRSKGERTIYLGQSVPIADLVQVVKAFDKKVTFVSLLMATPPAAEIPAFLQELRTLIPDERAAFWIAGGQLAKVPEINVPKGVSLHPSMVSLVGAVDSI